MSAASKFHQDCEALFGHKLGYGRRWKTAAAQALGIGRATLYRYFEDEDAVAPDIRARLDELAGDAKPVRSDRDMVTLFARGLMEVQQQVDAQGWLKDGYPPVLQRSFDLAAARNIMEPGALWPTDLRALAAVAEQPLFDWVTDLNWDPDGEFTAAKLIEDGEITPACVELAMPGRDPETELIERAGFGLLRSVCVDRRDGQKVYAAFRRAVVEHPVLGSWTTTILTDPILATVERVDEIVEAFYQRVPESLTLDGFLPTCVVSGTVLRRQGIGFHTESRDPEAIRRARSGDSAGVKWRHGTMQLRRAFRLYWCLPGKTELLLAERLRKARWTVELWPRLDRVDIAAVSPAGRRIAVDVKEHLSPENLAARFEGFKEYAADHECFLVVPDYMPEIARGYERRFEAVRRAHAKTPVALRTISALLSDLDVAR
ncbi:hypothetical protein [uncultured Methylobacterium sp.]|uniref:restriction endonuclease-related protein n=1 Tax=uncultured Methylobacterium sp. TaxID=157278 RepID=UPI0035CB0489